MAALRVHFNGCETCAFCLAQNLQILLYKKVFFQKQFNDAWQQTSFWSSVNVFKQIKMSEKFNLSEQLKSVWRAMIICLWAYKSVWNISEFGSESLNIQWIDERFVAKWKFQDLANRSKERREKICCTLLFQLQIVPILLLVMSITSVDVKFYFSWKKQNNHMWLLLCHCIVHNISLLHTV